VYCAVHIQADGFAVAHRRQVVGLERSIKSREPVVASEVIGWIDLDGAKWDAALDCGHPAVRFRSMYLGESVRTASDPAVPSDPTEFIAADCAQLRADLEAEFARLKWRGCAT
jgi:hypothetical protein